MTASPNECGTPEAFCPRGSTAPVPVSVGYYSVGGGADGKTRVSQVHFFQEIHGLAVRQRW